MITMAIICLLVIHMALHAQAVKTDVSYNDYVGKYGFAPGNPVEEVDVLIRDTSLTIATEIMGEPELITLKKPGIDSFEVNAYGAASIVFQRDAARLVQGLLLYTQSGRVVPAKMKKVIGRLLDMDTLMEMRRETDSSKPLGAPRSN